MNGNTQFFVSDSLGTARLITDASGSVCYDADFYPYGGERTAYTNTCSSVYKFEGKERDTETGNDDFGARYYSNRFGRWLSSDWSATPVPVPYANLTNPQTLNLYAMVADDPETSADLDGHCGPDGDNAACDSMAGTAFSGALSHPIEFLKGVVKRFANDVPVEDASPKDENMQWKPSNSMQAQGMQAEPLIVTAVSAVATLPEGGVGAAEEVSSNITANAAQGKAFEESVVAATKATDTNVAEQVTLRTNSGVKTRVDVVSTTESGSVRLQEAKSSASARLTPAQAAAHPEIERSGATVAGKGKPGYPGGRRIPPTKVEVVRPKPQN